MYRQLQELFEKRVGTYVSYSRNTNSFFPPAEKKKEVLANRNAEIVKAKATGKMLGQTVDGDFRAVSYQVHFQYLIKQKNHFYIEEEITERIGRFYKDELIADDEIDPFKALRGEPAFGDGIFSADAGDERVSYQYNRLRAVQYAERWWNSYNPAYKKFDVDCTSFVSQCLHQGGAPMTGYPNRNRGWWLSKNNWSYSWSVANALRIYLANSKSGLQAEEVEHPDQLLMGDVICYDFQGDGRFDHNTIVTAKDAYGMPLVNAHTYNSRMRYWAYEDSTAYTPNIKYKFYHIIDGK